MHDLKMLGKKPEGYEAKKIHRVFYINLAPVVSTRGARQSLVSCFALALESWVNRSSKESNKVLIRAHWGLCSLQNSLAPGPQLCAKPTADAKHSLAWRRAGREE